MEVRGREHGGLSGESVYCLGNHTGVSAYKERDTQRSQPLSLHSHVSICDRRPDQFAAVFPPGLLFSLTTTTATKRKKQRNTYRKPSHTLTLCLLALFKKRKNKKGADHLLYEGAI